MSEAKDKEQLFHLSPFSGLSSFDCLRPSGWAYLSYLTCLQALLLLTPAFYWGEEPEDR